jgi:Holliday junction resolvase RusA-like endonuclease
MSYELVLEIPRLPQMNVQHTRRHWSVGHREAKQWKQVIHGLLLSNGATRHKPLEKAHVALTRKSSREPDWDNLVMGFKPVLDALVKCGVLADDKPSNFATGAPSYLWESVTPLEGGIKIEVKEHPPLRTS